MDLKCATWLVLSICVGVAARTSSGETPTNLGAAPTEFDSIQSDFEFTSDGLSIIYRAAHVTVDGADELYSVPIAGGTAHKLNGDLGAGGDVDFWKLSPDGGWAIFWANEHGNSLTEVYGTPTLGGTPLKLNSPLVEIGSTGGVVVDGRVIYIASERTSPFAGTVFELFSVPVNGGTVSRLSGEPVNGGDVQTVVSRKGVGRVVYLADQERNDVVELFAVSPDGGPALKLNPQLVTQGNVLADGLQLSPTGNRVLYAADQERASVVEIFSVSTFGGPVAKLNGTLTNGGSVTPGSQLFSPDGTRVLYHADQNSDEVFELFSVSATGGTPVRLNGPLVLDGDVRREGLQFSPNGSRVLYTADQQTDETFELFSVASQGGAAVKLSGALVAGGDVADDAIFSPDGSRVLYRADQNTDEVVELYQRVRLGRHSAADQRRSGR